MNGSTGFVADMSQGERRTSTAQVEKIFRIRTPIELVETIPRTWTRNAACGEPKQLGDKGEGSLDGFQWESGA